MIRIRKIHICGFRGARYPVTFDLTSSCKSIAIFGENATGKSTITDAIEWFFRDRVEHLWREDCKEEALRNVHLAAADDALVSLDFNTKEISCEKRLKGKLNVVESSKEDAYKDYKTTAAGERLVLRTAYLTEFINKRKAEKRKELADIIGYEDLVQFRSFIVGALNSLEKDPEYTHAKRNQEESQGKLMKLAGTVLANEEQLFQKANELVMPFNPSVTISDNSSFQSCTEELKGKIGQQKKAEKRLKLGELKNGCESLIHALKLAQESGKGFIEPYTELVKSREKIRLLDIELFLSKGKEILDKGLIEGDRCPFCGSIVDLDHVNHEIEKRIFELKSIREEFEKTKGSKEQWLADLRDLNRGASELERKWTGLDVSAELPELARDLQVRMPALLGSINDKFQQYHEITEDPELRDISRRFCVSLEGQIKKADEEIALLELTTEEKAIVETLQALSDLRSVFHDYRRSLKVREAFENQIKTLAKIKDDFIKVQNEAFESALDLMSQGISKYYLFLHPPKHENVDDVRLRILGEEGMEFEYSFHGKKTHPPIKYLSESHLNSLGIALFLASVKLFNKESNFFVLDDVITSFDAGHRIRLLRLLQEEFKDWQVLLLTHERHWFEIIKKEIASAGWIICELDWTPENGIQVRGTPEDLHALIELKRSQGHDVANDLRTLVEKILKEICSSLEVKMAFRYNHNNENRMVGESLSDLRRTLNEKAPGLKDHSVFKQIETSNLLGTKGSHDRPKEISKGDIDIAMEDIDKLEALFRCDHCSRLVSRIHFVRAETKITCRCGKKEVEWSS